MDHLGAVSPAIVVLNRAGEDVARRIKSTLGGEIFAREDRAAGDIVFRDTIAQLQNLFEQDRAIIALCASGIVVRALAPLLVDKKNEPPVICVAHDGTSVVPLLGGHRRANDLAQHVGQILGGHVAITTGGDHAFGLALDADRVGYHLANQSDAKPFMARLLAGETCRIVGNADWIEKSNLPISDEAELVIEVTDRVVNGSDRHLMFHAKTLVVGVGCARGCPAQELVDLIEASLAEAGLSAYAIAFIGSLDLKADEAAIHAAARHFGVAARFFSGTELDEERGRLKNPSAVVDAEVGVAGVAEAVALKAGNLVVEKQKTANATCAIGQTAGEVLDPMLFGRAQGSIAVVGIGPGQPEWRSPEVRAALCDATDWVGYGLYLDLVADLKTDQLEHRFDLGKEEDRVRHALELAGQGKRVSLVCSGDAGIYAMAALVYELYEAEGARSLSDAARRVDVTIMPGISAFQAAAARAGALIGHDFCCISLSDLLTPRETILTRLEAAASGDFVTAFYNPRSLRRRDLLEKAVEIYAPHRSPDTPVIIASNLGRETEQVRVVNFADFKPDEVDMLTIVLFGASTSKWGVNGAGQSYAYTPRGYEKKQSQIKGQS